MSPFWKREIIAAIILMGVLALAIVLGVVLGES